MFGAFFVVSFTYVVCFCLLFNVALCGCIAFRFVYFWFAFGLRFVASGYYASRSLLFYGFVILLVTFGYLLFV